MRIRLHGTPQETTEALQALAKVLDIRSVSHPYPDRNTPMFQRIYIDATTIRNGKEAM
ncbi:hypothetical protein [Longispora albida]|uniref:hypothetical protein n=1 Tax=Longispora albida TaxID=203523 RepID=UPI0003A5FFE5|nr:hypothetical protein [Longispora albida]